MSGKIQFAELSKYNDSNSFVWTALTFNPKEKPDIEDFLKENKFLPDSSKIKSMKLIDGNVNGENGRTDVLFITTEAQFNPLVRLRIDGLKWTSDFIVNYGEDYGVYRAVQESEDD